MLLRSRSFAVTLAVAACLLRAPALWSQPMSRVVVPVLNDWQFLYRDVDRAALPVDGWEHVTVPHTWNRTDAQSGEHVQQGTGWYRRIITPDAGWKGRRVFAKFDGVGQVADVFLNGVNVGHHEGAYAAFTVDLTPALKWDAPDTLLVRANNESRPDIIPTNTNLFMVFGGIYRPVSLIVTDNVHVATTDFGSSGVAIRQTSVSKALARVNVRVKIDNNSTSTQPLTLRVRVRDQAGRDVAHKTTPLTVPHAGTTVASNDILIERPTLWHGRRNPYLYVTIVELLRDGVVIDAVTQPLGLRTYGFDPQRGFLLNGEPYRLYGVTRHQEWQDMGSALSDEQHRRDMAVVNEIGATSIRLAHYQQSDVVYNEADRLGILVWAEIPWVNRATGQEAANATQQLAELIRQQRNHPSIFVWGILNEVYATDANAPQVRLAKRLHDIAKTEDPDRPTISTSGYGDLERPMNWHTDLQAMNRYLGWYEGKTEDLESWLQMIEQKRPEGGVAIGEYGAEGNIHQHAEDVSSHEDPEKGQFFPEEYQTRFHEVQWAAIEKHPAIWGTYIWNLFDFAVPGWNRGGVKGRNQKGLITYDRTQRKDAFWFYKANWSSEPVLHLADARLAQRTTSTMRITVYSNVDSTTVTVNGTPLARGTSGGSKAHLIWNDIPLQMGANVVRVRGVRAGRVLTDSATFTRVAK